MDEEGGAEWYEGYQITMEHTNHVAFRWTACGEKDGRRIHGFGQTEPDALADVRQKIDLQIRMGS